MSRHAIVITITLAAALMALAHLFAFFPTLGEWWSAGLMVFGVSGIMVATMALGMHRKGGLGRLWILLATLFGLLVSSFGTALLLPLQEIGEPILWLGLPRRAAIVVYGVGIIPFLILPIVYALTFDDQIASPSRPTQVMSSARSIDP